ncbi:MAG TPA: PAS domain-containing sensor histidine kinase [Segetibacter sp.]|jgi:PAS domain S-box-containing protein
MLNKLLEQQIKEHFGTVEKVPEELSSFLTAISSTYNNCEDNLQTLRKTGDTSKELNELNSKLRIEADELKKAHNLLGTILNSVNQGFFSRDMITNQYTYLSPGCEKIYGFTVKEFFEDSLLWYKVIHPEDKIKIEEDNVRLNNEEEVSTQYRIILKDKSIKWIELKIIPCFKNGKLIRVDGIVNDISNRKKVETEREQMIKELVKTNTDLKQFSFITSHNLRAPLSNILGILTLLDYPNLNTYNAEIVDMIKTSAEQLNETINDLAKILVIKNNTNPELTTINIATTFKNVISSFNTALAEVSAEVIVDFKATSIVQNKVYLESIFVNLISNALRYRSTARNLIIHVQTQENENGNVVLRFSDNGTGIDLLRHQHKIFGLYQRFHSSVDGQGLGLFIVKSQIEATGGKIEVESQPDKGATFIITFKKFSEELELTNEEKVKH